MSRPLALSGASRLQNHRLIVHVFWRFSTGYIGLLYVLDVILTEVVLYAVGLLRFRLPFGTAVPWEMAQSRYQSTSWRPSSGPSSSSSTPVFRLLTENTEMTA